MTLRERIIRMIEMSGPIPVSVYMQICLHDTAQGYYATRPGLGRDFTTAPEISQIFGELIGLWVVHEWQAMGRPHPFLLVEPGAGRATMMSDALRAMEMTPEGKACLKAMQLYLIEPSHALRMVQIDKLSQYVPQFLVHLDDLPEMPAILISNEFLDCLPARQFVNRGNDTWVERQVGFDGDLCFGLTSGSITPPVTPPEHHKCIEFQPGLETFALSLAAHIEKRQKMRALVIDYGPEGLPPEDTLRAFIDGKQVPPLAYPGESDLTVDVDFAELKRQGKKAGLDVHGSVQQGHFLLALGAEARMQQLVKDNPDRADDIYARAARLIDPAEMGARFKAMCLSSPGLPKPAGF